MSEVQWCTEVMRGLLRAEYGWHSSHCDCAGGEQMGDCLLEGVHIGAGMPRQAYRGSVTR